MEAVEPLDRLFERALAGRPELLAVEQEVRAAGAFLDAAESERLPRLTAVASAGYARFETVARDRWVAGLGFSVPVFTGFSIDSRIDAARERLRAAEAARREVAQQVRHEVEKAYLELETAREITRVAQAQAAVAEETLRLASQRYGAQLGSFLDLVEAEVSRTAARQAHAQAAYDFKVGLATLEYVVGAPAAGAVRVVAR
jgi:outer membrane protein TolC